MCGIAGCVARGESTTPQQVVLDGLARLEYRGYDSAGIAVAAATGLQVRKKEGKLANLLADLDADPLAVARAAIGHTRWATHGSPSDTNAHPHVSADGNIAIVHNGIIENAEVLRAELSERGIRFASDTDSEVIAHLLACAVADDETDETAVTPDVEIPRGIAEEHRAAAGRLARALVRLVPRLEGTFTILALDGRCPEMIAAARRSSPLMIGRGADATYLSSDALAFADLADDCLEIGQDEVALVGAEDIRIVAADGSAAEATPFDYSFAVDDVSKGEWATFMDKEIHEQPRAVAETLRERTDASGLLVLDELRIPAHVLREVDKIIVIACGTSAYAGQVARYAIEHWCRIPCEVELASEFRYRDPIVSQKTLIVAISQSGETMDTIQAIRHAREQGAKVLAIVNTPGSTIAREADAVLVTHAGREIAVASTKAFTAQVTACYILGLYLAQVRGNKYGDEIADYLAKLSEVPAKMERLLGQLDPVVEVAHELAHSASSFIFIGRHVGFPVALEGALKLKEIAYVHAEGFAAGELKHGPIALVESGVPVVVIVPTPRRPELHRKVVSTIQEVRARGARTIVIAEEGDASVEAWADTLVRVPQTPTLYMPLLTVIPLQVLAAQVATDLGYDVDQPRNLAKSVTVE
ncbi:glutamine--fructose-6-phosphate transaminase (isomerizing) [Nanchangia anserum]|uniref:Glutamine--fructose-6-phosphate aminotransferase [isomerizing] n=1 Tax=Nanchangia anserum TaxID=2692125 RepID=A0A8I0GH88_9ACTO|nr:glutamine--fructose-6-phosphate transaminase (isomerizing) [Nanchangia anserum]MBD3689959.1 glutamine--fructose-6-phosphate transaminase (isomerizing) [Nanchangia anserum]QOX82234.1 glutamine--fructose-6-phosphate transaminase (isomerizing) [Nanchangia anserum]